MLVRAQAQTSIQQHGTPSPRDISGEVLWGYTNTQITNCLVGQRLIGGAEESFCGAMDMPVFVCVNTACIPIPHAAVSVRGSLTAWSRIEQANRPARNCRN